MFVQKSTQKITQTIVFYGEYLFFSVENYRFSNFPISPLPKQICYIIHQQHPKQEHCHTASYLQSFQYLVLLQPLAMFDDDND